jgi:hypothetical protein
METIFIHLIEDEDVEVEVDFKYYEEEPMVMYYSDMSGHPGDSAYTEIFSVRLNGICILNVMSSKAIDDIAERITEKLDPYNQ